MADVAVLWMASVACFIVAFIGKAVTIGSVQIPGIAEKKVARIGMAIVGTLALVLGLMIFVRPNGDQEPAQAAVKTRSTSIPSLSPQPTDQSQTNGSPTASPSSSAQPSSSTGPPVYLADQPIDPGSTSPPQTGTWSMLHHSYARSIGYLGDNNVCGPDSATISYGLGGRYQWFQATVGLNDDAAPADQEMASNTGADFTVQANTGGGSMRTIFDGQEWWGHPVQIQVSVVDATLLQLETNGCLSSSDSVAVWGSARLLP